MQAIRQRFEIMQRDEKGRFIKGITPEGAVPFSEGTAKEMQARSAEARKRNITMRELALEFGNLGQSINMPDGSKKDTTMLGAVVVGQIRSAQKGNPKAAEWLAKILGEYEINLNISADDDRRPEIVIE